VKNAESLGCLSIVLVNLREAVRKLVKCGEDSVIRRKLYKFVVGKDLSKLLPKGLVHPIIVIGVEKAPSDQMLT
jgi:hypothetical protein